MSEKIVRSRAQACQTWAATASQSKIDNHRKWMNMMDISMNAFKFEDPSRRFKKILTVFPLFDSVTGSSIQNSTGPTPREKHTCGKEELLPGIWNDELGYKAAIQICRLLSWP